MQSAETVASAIRDMGNKQENMQTNEMILWIEHKSKERAKHRELRKLELEYKERESKRKYKLEMMRMRSIGMGITQPVLPRHLQQFAPGCGIITVKDRTLRHRILVKHITHVHKLDMSWYAEMKIYIFSLQQQLFLQVLILFTFATEKGGLQLSLCF